MRNCWVGDIADFAKYALLRRLAGSNFRIGVLWYLTTHSNPTTPLTKYLRNPDHYRPLDPIVFDRLHKLEPGKDRKLTVKDIEREGVLPVSTVFYPSPLETSNLDRSRRSGERQRWFAQGLARIEDCNLVFFDPDTGLLPSARKCHNARGEEYATLEEILEVCRRGQSVVCVQFGAPQNFEREPKIARDRLATLHIRLAAEGFPDPFGIWWPDRHKVGLLIAPCKSHAVTLRKRWNAILNDPIWSGKVRALGIPSATTESA